MEARSRPFSQISPSLGSRSAIIRRKRLFPDPDGPVIAAHAPLPRYSSNGPANSLRNCFTSSAVCIEYPCLQQRCLCTQRLYPDRDHPNSKRRVFTLDLRPWHFSIGRGSITTLLSDRPDISRTSRTDANAPSRHVARSHGAVSFSSPVGAP